MFDIAGRDPLIDVAVALEKAARNDDFFVKRNLYPNVDFYSGAHHDARRVSALALLTRQCWPAGR